MIGRHSFFEEKLRQTNESVSTFEKINQKLDTLLLIVGAEYPELSVVKVERFSPSDMYDMGGFFDFDIDTHGNITPKVCVSEGDPELLRPLLDIRQSSVKLNADLLGVPSTALTPEILQLFIIAHEFGHSQDFVRNYQNDPHLSGPEAIEEMDSHRYSALASLPVPNISPTDLIRELAGIQDIDAVVEKYPEIKKHPNAIQVRSIQDLIELQEREYRETPPERYADEFARTFLLRHSEQLKLFS